MGEDRGEGSAEALGTTGLGGAKGLGGAPPTGT